MNADRYFHDHSFILKKVKEVAAFPGPAPKLGKGPGHICQKNPHNYVVSAVFVLGRQLSITT